MEIDMISWMMRNHHSSITCAELRKYIPIFKSDDQELIDDFLDEEQRQLNFRQPELDRLEALAEQEQARLRIIELNQ
jgi:succinate dehydrogenase flavin-adding protein (antitoxin of CptAB toxin-antitoxin module)